MALNFPSLFILTFLFSTSLKATSLQQDDQTSTDAKAVTLKTHTEPLSLLSPDQFYGVSNEEIEDLFQHSNDLVCIMDYGGKLIRINKKWQQVLGYEDQELMGSPYHTFIHPKDLQKTIEYEKRYTYAGLINRYRCHNGLYRWLDWMGLPHKTRDQASRYRFALARDITVHKLYEKELSKTVKTKAKADGLQKVLLIEAVAAVQAAQVGDLLSQEGGGDNSRTLGVILQNFIQLTESSFGFIGEIFYDFQEHASFKQRWSANTLATSDAQDVCAANNITAVQGLGFDPFLKRVVQEKKPLIFDNIQEVFEGGEIPQAYRSIKTFLGIPLFNRGELTGVVGLSNHHDLVGVIGLANRQRGYDDALLDWLEPLRLVAGKATGEAKQERLKKIIDNERQERIRAEQASHMKTLFIAHMSHELRTPLTGILGNLDLIRKELLSSENLTYLQNAQLAGQSLLYIANDILDAAKLEAGIFKLEEKEFVFRKALQETIDVLKSDIQAKKLALHLNVASEVPEQVTGDVLRFRQIVFNLLNNAYKFTNTGTIKLDFQTRIDPQQKDRLILSGQVQDTGLGMTEETLERVFKPFSQGDNALYRQFGGTGLGLHLTRQICEAMGGQISAQSQIGQGSTFSFDITLRQPERRLSFSGDGKPFPALKILMADDNVMIQKLFTSILKKLGCQVTIAPNGLEALQAVKADSYDVVLMDGEMPIMDGLESTRQIRRYLGSKPLPIIGVTAHALASDRTRFLASGMDGYLTKPVKLVDLKTEILRCLTLNKS